MTTRGMVPAKETESHPSGDPRYLRDSLRSMRPAAEWLLRDPSAVFETAA